MILTEASATVFGNEASTYKRGVSGGFEYLLTWLHEKYAIVLAAGSEK